MVTWEWGEFVYAPPETVHADRIVLDKDEAHHLFRVWRVRENETVFATTGTGIVHECKVGQSENRKSKIEGPSPYLQIVKSHAAFGEPPTKIFLGMAALKGDGSREITDLATQLGVHAIYFFRAERSEGKLSEEKLGKLRRTAVTAIKQCGRAWLPEITLCSNLETVLATVPGDSTVFIANPANVSKVDQTTRLELNNIVVLLVGPEGGFTEKEVKLALRQGSALHLGNRRLRAGTAVAAGISYLMTKAGDFRTSDKLTS